MSSTTTGSVHNSRGRKQIIQWHSQTLGHSLGRLNATQDGILLGLIEPAPRIATTLQMESTIHARRQAQASTGTSKWGLRATPDPQRTSRVSTLNSTRQSLPRRSRRRNREQRRFPPVYADAAQTRGIHGVTTRFICRSGSDDADAGL